MSLNLPPFTDPRVRGAFTAGDGKWDDRGYTIDSLRGSVGAMALQLQVAGYEVEGALVCPPLAAQILQYFPPEDWPPKAYITGFPVYEDGDPPRVRFIVSTELYAEPTPDVL